MLRINVIRSAAAAQTYFTRDDYYQDGTELPGRWGGKLAQELHFQGVVQQDAFFRLMDGCDPHDGQQLTARKLQDGERRAGYDATFLAPKSVSLAYELLQSPEILQAHRQAVDTAMQAMEQDAAVRVRKGGADHDRTSGNLAWAAYDHFTGRPARDDLLPDMLLHTHVVVANLSYDSKEKQVKALQAGEIKRMAPFYEAIYHSQLAHSLQSLGYEIRRKGRDWEIAGFEDSLIARFSRRQQEVENLANDLGVTDPQAKEKLGATSRLNKQKNLSHEELRLYWRSRLTDSEWAEIQQLQKAAIQRGNRFQDATTEVVDFMRQHGFERNSVLEEKRFLADALRAGIGQTTPERLQEALQTADFVRANFQGRRVITTKEVLQEESRIIAFARGGRGRYAPLAAQARLPNNSLLNEGQRHAVTAIWKSSDRIMVIEGAAGTGKTTMLKTAVAGLQSAGQSVQLLAPSAQASRSVLRGEGFSEADTVARFLLDGDLQQKVRGGVIIADEAGLLGHKTTLALFDKAKELDARVILLGDPHQHGSVERGATLALLQNQAGIKPVRMWDIRRQKGLYKQAVAALSQGQIQKGLQQLDKLGWIQEGGHDVIANAYLQATKEGNSALIVSPTHREGEQIVERVRAKLREDGQIGLHDRTITRLVPLHLTEAERGRMDRYAPGDVVQFFRSAPGIKPGQRLAPNEDLTSYAKRFQAYRPVPMAISEGDLLRITANGKAKTGQRLYNGNLVRVSGFDSEGNILTDKGAVIARDFGHLMHGLVSTSHASQGQTTDVVIIGQSSQSFAATSREQGYVSVSRARERCLVVTDDKQALLQALQRSERKLVASDVFRHRSKHGQKWLRHWQRWRQLAVKRQELNPKMAQQTHQPYQR